MKTITEDYCDFETAKLLKEKGFDEACKAVYEEGIQRINTLCDYYNSELSSYVCAPTHQMAMKYLRETHKLFITIDWTGYENEYIWSIQDMNSGMCWESDESYILYEHACQAAIKYCLENLI